LIKWFQKVNSPTKLSPDSDSKQQVDDFAGDLSFWKAFDSYMVWDKNEDGGVEGDGERVLGAGSHAHESLERHARLCWV